jgi:PBP1b-binding outer membrane lipoprotein LpoB
MRSVAIYIVVAVIALVGCTGEKAKTRAEAEKELFKETDVNSLPKSMRDRLPNSGGMPPKPSTP